MTEPQKKTQILEALNILWQWQVSLIDDLWQEPDDGTQGPAPAILLSPPEDAPPAGTANAELEELIQALEQELTPSPDAALLTLAELAQASAEPDEEAPLSAEGEQKTAETVFLPAAKSGWRKRMGKGLSALVFYGALLCVLGGAFLLLRGNRKPICGYSFLNVLTRSMQSEIPQGSLIAVRRVDPDAVRIGDDITYMKDAGTTVTHRVVGIKENFEDSGARGFETQGIENDVPDGATVPADRLVGRVAFHIPLLGGWLDWLRRHILITLLLAAGLSVLLLILRRVLRKGAASGLSPAPAG